MFASPFIILFWRSSGFLFRVWTIWPTSRSATSGTRNPRQSYSRCFRARVFPRIIISTPATPRTAIRIVTGISALLVPLWIVITVPMGATPVSVAIRRCAAATRLAMTHVTFLIGRVALWPTSTLTFGRFFLDGSRFAKRKCLASPAWKIWAALNFSV